MPTLMDRITDFFKPKKPYQQGAAAKPRVAGNSATASSGAAGATKRKTAGKRKPAAKKVAAKATATTKPAARKGAAKPTGKAKTREQLYKQATRLKIPGRTKMSKAQLERAIAKAKK